MSTATKKYRYLALPSVDYDRQLSHMLGVEGPDDIMKLADEAAMCVRDVLDVHYDVTIPDNICFGSLIVPYMFEARRIGDRRGQKRASSMLAGLFPGTE